MLSRLSNSREAAEAFAGIPEEAKKALAMRLEEEEKAFAKGAEKVAKEEKKKFFAKKAEEAARAFVNSAEEATKTFAKKAPFLIDDCVEAREIYAFKHQAQVERLRNIPSDEEMLTKLAEVAVYIGESYEHDIEAIRMMGVALGYRRRHHEYERLSTSRRGDRAAARSEAIAWIKSSVLRLSGKSPPRPKDRQVRHRAHNSPVRRRSRHQRHNQ
jgi:hypothetical protein